MVVCGLVEALGKQILSEVVLALLGVGLVAVAGVEALGQEQEPTDSVSGTGLPRIARMTNWNMA